MSLRDFGLLVVICFCWSSNVLVSRYVIGVWDVPPIFYAALRFAGVAVLVWPFLRPMPRPFWRLFAVAMCMGAANFAFLNLGLQTATASSAAVVSQLGVPITTVLSVLMLGEKIGWRRGLGIGLAFGGAMLVIVDPAEGFDVSAGLLLVLGCAFTASMGNILLKQMEDVKPLTFQAWISILSAPPLILWTLTLETGQVEAVAAAGWPFVAAAAFAVLAVSLFAHTMFYHLIGKYDATLLSPLTLMGPLGTVALGVVLLGEPFGLRMAVGTAVALTGVLLIALRSNRKLPEATLTPAEAQG